MAASPKKVVLDVRIEHVLGFEKLPCVVMDFEHFVKSTEDKFAKTDIIRKYVKNHHPENNYHTADPQLLKDFENRHVFDLHVYDSNHQMQFFLNDLRIVDCAHIGLKTTGFLSRLPQDIVNLLVDMLVPCQNNEEDLLRQVVLLSSIPYLELEPKICINQVMQDHQDFLKHYGSILDHETRINVVCETMNAKVDQLFDIVLKQDQQIKQLTALVTKSAKDSRQMHTELLQSISSQFDMQGRIFSPLSHIPSDVPRSKPKKSAIKRQLTMNHYDMCPPVEKEGPPPKTVKFSDSNKDAEDIASNAHVQRDENHIQDA